MISHTNPLVLLTLVSTLLPSNLSPLSKVRPRVYPSIPLASPSDLVELCVKQEHSIIRMDALKAVQTYLQKMLSEVPGMKVLLMDAHTVSATRSQSVNVKSYGPAVIHPAPIAGEQEGSYGRRGIRV